MFGIEDYGSGSDSESESNKNSTPQTAPLKPKAGLSLPPPKAKRGPKKFTIAIPDLPSAKDDDDDADERPSKKPRIQTSAGRSGLLAMLPAPKQKAPVPAAPERTLGSGKGPGLVFTTRPSGNYDNTSLKELKEEGDEDGQGKGLDEREFETKRKSSPPPLSSGTAFSFLPPSLAKGKANISLEDDRPTRRGPTQQKPAEPAVDFFSLGNTSSASKPSISSAPSTSSFSAAPAIPTFEPPEPTPNDEYPGYYQLPSGAWAAHDPDYFASFMKKWEAEYNAHVRALEKGMVKGFEGLDSAEVEEVDALKEMEKAKLEIRDREEKKNLTMGADGGPVAPKMKINASKMSGIARSRHQLSTLLNEAYTNREALEERIAQGRRNRKEAGNKYGF